MINGTNILKILRSLNGIRTTSVRVQIKKNESSVSYQYGGDTSVNSKGTNIVEQKTHPAYRWVYSVTFQELFCLSQVLNCWLEESLNLHALKNCVWVALRENMTRVWINVFHHFHRDSIHLFS